MIRQASSKDLDKVISLLKSVSLPSEDIHLHFNNYLVHEFEGNIVGTIGLEIYGAIVLLRSLAVAEEFQKRGLGQKLYLKLLEEIQSMGISEIYLLTETAEKFFNKQGFISISREAAPSQIKQSYEFSNLCPSTAVCMCKKLNRGI
jgi:N-acetylglutamate synthase-like GNAT family acetyltransferase